MALDLPTFKRFMMSYPQRLQSQVFQEQQVKNWLLKSLIEQSHYADIMKGQQERSRYGKALDELVAVARNMCNDQPNPVDCMRAFLQTVGSLSGQFAPPKVPYEKTRGEFYPALARAITGKYTDETGQIRVPESITEDIPTLIEGMGLTPTLKGVEAGREEAYKLKQLGVREEELTQKKEAEKRMKEEMQLRKKNYEQRIKEYDLRLKELEQRKIEHEAGGKGKDAKLESLWKQLTLAEKNIAVAQKKFDEEVTPDSEQALVDAFAEFDEAHAKVSEYLAENIKSDYEIVKDRLIQKGLSEEEADKLARANTSGPTG